MSTETDVDCCFEAGVPEGPDPAEAPGVFWVSGLQILFLFILGIVQLLGQILICLFVDLGRDASRVGFRIRKIHRSHPVRPRRDNGKWKSDMCWKHGCAKGVTLFKGVGPDH